MVRFVDEVRTVLRDATNVWHLESSQEITRRFTQLPADEQMQARADLARVKEALRAVYTRIYQVKG